MNRKRKKSHIQVEFRTGGQLHGFRERNLVGHQVAGRPGQDRASIETTIGASSARTAGGTLWPPVSTYTGKLGPLELPVPCPRHHARPGRLSCPAEGEGGEKQADDEERA